MNASSLDHRDRRPATWLAIAGLTAALLGTIVLLVQRSPWAGPAVANGLRRVIGDRAVTELEEVWADAQDHVMRVVRGHRRPRELRDLSPPAPSPASVPDAAMPARAAPVPEASREADGSADAGAGAGVDGNDQEPRLRVEPVSPPFPSVAAPDDGQWYPVVDPDHPEAPTLMYRTLIHPDPERTYAELFLVVLPVESIELRLVAGTEEPESDDPDVRRLEPRGLIAARDDAALLMAFNGGFRARHGRHGMVLGGVTLLPLREGSCTIIGGRDLQVRSWRRGDRMEPGAWYRQTPPCMVEQGTLHPGLANPQSRKWGATLEGETVIRRSALALDRRGERLYVGISNFTTAAALALGMQRAGGWTVAQLDVNWSYPKILLFPRDRAGVRHAVSLFEGFLFQREEMLRQPSPRDFFYVVRR